VIQFLRIDPAVEVQVASAYWHSNLKDGLPLHRPPKGASGYVHIIRSEVAFLFLCDKFPVLISASIKGDLMRKVELAIPEVALIAGTRVMLGAGAALLLADQLNVKERKKFGWAMFLMGAISTIPLVIDVFSKRK